MLRFIKGAKYANFFYQKLCNKGEEKVYTEANMKVRRKK